MSQQTNWMLKFMHVLAWIAFIGLCVKAGTVIVGYCVGEFRNPAATWDLYMGLDLSQLKKADPVAYTILVFCVVGILVMEAFLFFFLVLMFRKINFVHPFHEAIGKLITRMSLLSLFIGILSKLTVDFSNRYVKEGMQFPHLNEHIGQGEAFLFFAGILFVIATVFKKGIELQKENELTV